MRQPESKRRHVESTVSNSDFIDLLRDIIFDSAKQTQALGRLVDAVNNSGREHKIDKILALLEKLEAEEQKKRDREDLVVRHQQEMEKLKYKGRMNLVGQIISYVLGAGGLLLYIISQVM